MLSKWTDEVCTAPVAGWKGMNLKAADEAKWRPSYYPEPIFPSFSIVNIGFALKKC